MNVILVKLGGSIITNKESPRKVRHEILRRLVREIAQAREVTQDLIIVGHGSGSFAHAPAMRYRTMDGFVDEESVIGMAITQDSAAQLNRIVVGEFINQHVPAVSYLFSNCMVTNNREAAHWNGHVLQEYLAKGLFPVTAGDVLVDQKNGCTIWSTENVLSFLATELPKLNPMYKVSKIVHVTEVAGVLDLDRQVIPVITADTYPQIKEVLGITRGFDVTGGMGHKIEESLELAELGIESCIISGSQPGNLYKVLLGEECVMTTVKPTRK